MVASNTRKGARVFAMLVLLLAVLGFMKGCTAASVSDSELRMLASYTKEKNKSSSEDATGADSTAAGSVTSLYYSRFEKLSEEQIPTYEKFLRYMKYNSWALMAVYLALGVAGVFLGRHMSAKLGLFYVTGVVALVLHITGSYWQISKNSLAWSHGSEAPLTALLVALHSPVFIFNVVLLILAQFVVNPGKPGEG